LLAQAIGLPCAGLQVRIADMARHRNSREDRRWTSIEPHRSAGRPRAVLAPTGDDLIVDCSAAMQRYSVDSEFVARI
jgi:hypothetical protein